MFPCETKAIKISWFVIRAKVQNKFFPQFECFQTITPLWIHRWLWNDAQSLEVALKRCPIVFQGHLSNFKVRRDRKSQGFFYLNLEFPECNSSLIHWWPGNDTQDWRSLEQSGTKPNLVAKIWPPTLVTICAWLSKLVANVSSQFHHLGDNGAAIWQLNVRSDSAFVDHLESRAGASTTRVLVLPKMINMNILKTLYSSTTRVLIFQYLYSYVQYSPQPCLSHKYVIIT